MSACTVRVQKLEMILNSVFCCVMLVVPVRAYLPIVNLPKCNLMCRPRDVEVNEAMKAEQRHFGNATWRV